MSLPQEIKALMKRALEDDDLEATNELTRLLNRKGYGQPPKKEASKPGEPREHTQEECQDELMHYLVNITRYWIRQRPNNTREACEGLLFSFLVLLDGGTSSLPSLCVFADPHPDDKPSHKEDGENWWPEFPWSLVGDNCVQINRDALHEILNSYLSPERPAQEILEEDLLMDARVRWAQGFEERVALMDAILIGAEGPPTPPTEGD